ncbi:transposase [Neoasaia chiangmaiensis NBRC 101099]|nr:transposase [Neoasaia chiangmaiensis NBRC 101099]
MPEPSKKGLGSGHRAIPGRSDHKDPPICDALGNPMEIDITPGQDADISLAEPMLDNIEPDAFLADKAYDADRLTD